MTVAAGALFGVCAVLMTSSTGLGADPPAEVEFSHLTAAHRKACDACHTFPSANWKRVRDEKSAFPDVTEFPQHASCIGCHKEQFFARERPAPRICSVCHVGVTPKFTDRRPFPNPLATFRTSDRAKRFVSDFRVSFPHTTHFDLLGETGAGESCASCHQTYQPLGKSGDEYATAPPKDLGDRFWLKKGTFKTRPDSHETCFTCHVQEGAAPDCAMCHKLADPAAAPGGDFDARRAAEMGVVDPVMLDAWRRRDSSATFPHDGGMHADLKCASCHDLAKTDTTDPRTSVVRVQSCGGEMGCHITATLDEGGILNFELDRKSADASFRCEKCHIALGAAPAPASHTSTAKGPAAP